MREQQGITEEVQEGDWQLPIATVKRTPLKNWLGTL